MGFPCQVVFKNGLIYHGDQVIVYKICKSNPGDMSPKVLEEVGNWNHNYFVTSLAAREDTLIVGDAISSVSILKVDGNELRTVARHYGPMWPVAVEAVQNGVIGANVRISCSVLSCDVSDGCGMTVRLQLVHV